MITILIVLSVSIIVGIAVCKLLADVRKIKRNGVEVEGVIFDFSMEQWTDATNTNSTSYYPIVRFLTKDDNKWITKESRIGIPYSAYKAGTKVRIIYEQNNPQNFFIDDKYTRFIPKLFLCIAIMLIVYCIVKLIHI